MAVLGMRHSAAKSDLAGKGWPLSPLTRLVSRLIRCYRDFRDDDRGNSESALVLIPLIFLFLCAMQLIVVIFLRNESSVISQSKASIRAISGELLPTDRIIALRSPDKFQDIKLLITRERREIPLLIPGLAPLLGEVIRSTQNGIAIVEER